MFLPRTAAVMARSGLARVLRLTVAMATTVPAALTLVRLLRTTALTSGRILRRCAD